MIDDYGELLYLQTLLKKLGFDVDGIQNERQFEDTFLALNPEVIVATAVGKRVNGVAMAEQLNRVRGLPKVVLIAPAPQMEKLGGRQIENVDAILQSPVSPNHLLVTLAETNSLDKDHLLEKYRKLKSSLSPERESDLQILNRDLDQGGVNESPMGRVTSKVSLVPSSLGDQERRDRFKKSLDLLERPQTQHFPREKVIGYHREIRATENDEDIADLEAERQDFARKLFRR